VEEEGDADLGRTGAETAAPAPAPATGLLLLPPPLPVLVLCPLFTDRGRSTRITVRGVIATPPFFCTDANAIPPLFVPQILVQRRIHQTRKEREKTRTHTYTQRQTILSQGGKKHKKKSEGIDNTTKQTQRNKGGRASEPATESEAKGKRPGEVGERRRGVVGWGGDRDAQQEQQGAAARTDRQLGLHIRVQK